MRSAITIQRIYGGFSVCKVEDHTGIDLGREFCFTGKTDEEYSLVCRTEDVPDRVLERNDGWRAFRIKGVLDFSLIGVLSKIATLLAEHEIGIFVVSTYNTDYILTKEENYDKALQLLADAGYQIGTL